LAIKIERKSEQLTTILYVKTESKNENEPAQVISTFNPTEIDRLIERIDKVIQRLGK
jgi:hypothetical protein